MRLIDTDKLKFPNIAVFEMKLHGTMVPMVRLIDLKELMPTVDAVPVKHGRWKPSPYLEGMFKCSVCGDEWGATAKLIPMMYCPACGAKMDLGEE